jgi:hypothetical protein
MLGICRSVTSQRASFKAICFPMVDYKCKRQRNPSATSLGQLRRS